MLQNAEGRTRGDARAHLRFREPGGDRRHQGRRPQPAPRQARDPPRVGVGESLEQQRAHGEGGVRAAEARTIRAIPAAGDGLAFPVAQSRATALDDGHVEPYVLIPELVTAARPSLSPLELFSLLATPLPAAVGPATPTPFDLLADGDLAAVRRAVHQALDGAQRG